METLIEINNPEKEIDLTEFATEELLKDLKRFKMKGIKYSLVATLNQYGDVNFGHYIAICKRPVNPNDPNGPKKWYRFDDLNVTREADRFAITRNAVCFVFELQTNDEYDYDEEFKNLRAWHVTQSDKG